MRFVFAIGLAFAVLLTVGLDASIRDLQFYGIIEDAVFEPNERAPQRIRLYGAFALLHTNQQPPATTGPYSPQRGYLYFKLPSERPLQEAARKEWADLKAMAGTGQAITFGSWKSAYYGTTSSTRVNGFVSASNPEESLRVLTDKDRGDAVTYTVDTGVVKLANAGVHGTITQMLRDALKTQQAAQR